MKPVRQPLHRLSEEKRGVVGEEIARLLAAGFIAVGVPLFARTGAIERWGQVVRDNKIEAPSN